MTMKKARGIRLITNHGGKKRVRMLTEKNIMFQTVLVSPNGEVWEFILGFQDKEWFVMKKLKSLFISSEFEVLPDSTKALKIYNTEVGHHLFSYGWRRYKPTGRRV